MQYVLKSLPYLVAALAAAAGLAKLMGAEQEQVFFQNLGLPLSSVLVFGAFQVGFAMLLVLPRPRKIGALGSAIFLALSSIMIAATGDLVFAFVSLVPVAAALVVAFHASRLPIR